MTATLSTQNSNARNLSDKKELVKAWSLCHLSDGEIREAITVRWWMGRSSSASRVYCSVWVHGKDFYTSGHGQAGGGGYDKASAAFAAAVDSAGIQLAADVDGRGDQAVRDAMHYIADATGCGFVRCITSHG